MQHSRSTSMFSHLPGIGLCLAISVLAFGLGKAFPLIGGPVFGILLGIAAGNLISWPASTAGGIRFCSKKVLQYAIVALGAGLSLRQIWQIGSESVTVMLATLIAALAGAWIIGRLLKVSTNLTGLIGVGTGICGGSAIAAISPIIDAHDDEIAFSVSTVFLFNVVAVVVFPALGHLLGLSQKGFGLWAGTAINDTSSVVAAAYSYSSFSGDYATVTKLARTTMIIPIALILSVLISRKSEGTQANIIRIFPWFILGFAAASLLNTLGLLGSHLPSQIAAIGKYLIIVALAGIGLGANLTKMIKTGPRPILLGLLVWVLVAITSLALQKLSGQF